MLKPADAVWQKPHRQKAETEKTDKTQSERFKETARKLSADENPHKFERAFRKLVPPNLA
jgi:hypothetical protein